MEPGLLLFGVNVNTANPQQIKLSPPVVRLTFNVAKINL